jgi:peptidyl-dipeptidase Dcp
MHKSRTRGPNPLLEPWTGPFEVPPFDRLKPDHFNEAFQIALAAAQDEIAAIAANPEPPTFTNTIEALERSGRQLTRISCVFFNLVTANSNDELEAAEREFAPKLARHRSEVFSSGALFRRVDDLHARRAGLGLDPGQLQVLGRYHTAFLRNSAGAPDAIKGRLTAIAARLAELGTKFSQNVLASEKAFRLVLESEEDLAGLPLSLISAAAAAAADRGLPGKHVITLARSSIEPFLQFSARRDLREKAFQAWSRRGEAKGPADNRAIAAEMMQLRAERARLLSFESFAHFRLADMMATTPQAALELLHSVWHPAVSRAKGEEEALQAIAAAEGGNFRIAPWDWRYYTEKRRKAELGFDESEIKPYLQLEKMIEAAFFAASRLFGLSFSERKDIPLYHPDARCWTVTGRSGREIALFIGDYFARPSKRSGAWMNSFREQQKLGGEARPIVVNVMNFAKPAAGQACLLSFDDARTLFHEFGHALHGMLSDVTYPLISGTNVARDFVEFPSQLFEHWLEQPETLRRFALHHETGAPLPEPLLQGLVAATQFNQGFATVEYTASALVDLALHLQPDAPADVAAFEKQELEKLGMPPSIAMRHRTPHFQHIFSSDSYAAAYYSYLWSDVLAADGFEAFEERGDIFDPVAAERLYRHIYSAGFSRAPGEAFKDYRGREASPGALLRRRGFTEASGAEA